MGPAGRAHPASKLRLDAGQPRAVNVHLWASLVARLLALLLLCSLTCAAAATGGAAVRPAPCACGAPAWPAWPPYDSHLAAQPLNKQCAHKLMHLL